MALFKKKETKPIKTEVSRNTREIEGLAEAFAEQPVQVEEPVVIEEPKSLLEAAEGVYQPIDINKLTFRKAAVKTPELIVRKNGDVYELIGFNQVEVKVIEASDDEVSLMLLDHMLKNYNLPEQKKLNILKYEMQNAETVKRLSGKTPAELNGVTDEYFASLVVMDSVDEKLRSLSSDALLEAAKLPKDVQSILGNIVSNIGPAKVTANAVKALQGVKADETAILMSLLQA